MANIRLVAIVPKKAFVGNPQAAAQAVAALTKWQGEIVKELRDYPPQQPAWGASQSLGKRAGASTAKRTNVGPKTYRRTGTLGRNWTPKTTKYSVTVSNAVPYSGYVQGFLKGPKGSKQTAVMASKGWGSITTIHRPHSARLRLELKKALGKGPA